MAQAPASGPMGPRAEFKIEVNIAVGFALDVGVAVAVAAACAGAVAWTCSLSSALRERVRSYARVPKATELHQVADLLRRGRKARRADFPHARTRGDDQEGECAALYLPTRLLLSPTAYIRCHDTWAFTSILNSAHGIK